jgi:hypothetical protein
MLFTEFFNLVELCGWYGHERTLRCIDYILNPRLSKVSSVEYLDAGILGIRLKPFRFFEYNAGQFITVQACHRPHRRGFLQGSFCHIAACTCSGFKRMPHFVSGLFH